MGEVPIILRTFVNPGHGVAWVWVQDQKSRYDGKEAEDGRASVEGQLDFIRPGRVERRGTRSCR